MGAYLLRMGDGGGFGCKVGRGICYGIVGARVRRVTYSRTGYIIVCLCLVYSLRGLWWRKRLYPIWLVLLSMRAIGACKYAGRCGIVQYVQQRFLLSGVLN